MPFWDKAFQKKQGVDSVQSENTADVPDNDDIADIHKDTDIYRIVEHSGSGENGENAADDTEVTDDLPEDTYSAECEETRISTKEKEKNRVLFDKLDSVVTREKLFLNPDLSCGYFVKLIGVNKTSVGRILQQNTGLNTTGYINEKRLEYAAKLLKNDSDSTIQTIAEACGLPNIPTFNRLFRSKFGMTPSEYRKIR